MDAIPSALIQVACLLSPVATMFLYGLIRFSIENLRERRMAHDRATTILHNVMARNYYN